MENNKTTQLSADEKKNNAFKKLVEKGKTVGHLTAQEIDNLIVELDLDVDELENAEEEEAEEERTVPNEETQQDTQPVSSWQWEYLKYIAMGIALSVVLLLAVVLIGKRR